MRRTELPSSWALSIGLHLGTVLLLLLLVRPAPPIQLTGPTERSPLMFELGAVDTPASAAPTRTVEALRKPPRPTPVDAEAVPTPASQPASRSALHKSLDATALSPLARRLEETFRRELTYPAALRRARRQGIVQLKIVLKEDGAMSGAIWKGSGDRDLDRIAESALSRALEDRGLHQDARRTAKSAGREVSFTLPVRFVIK